MKPSILLVYISLILFSLACKLLTPVTASMPPTATQTEPSSIPTQIEKKTFIPSSTPATQPQATSRPAAAPNTAFDLSQTGKTIKDVTYCTVNGVELKMDLHFPRRLNPKDWPAVIYIHGGAWQKGDKSEGAGFKAVEGLQSAGFIVIAINYRLAPEYIFPAQIEDVKCAVRSLRAHAAQYNLDATRIGTWGGSAGGHLASLLGTSGGIGDWDTGEYSDQSSIVQAVLDMYGPSDLTTNYDSSNNENSKIVFGASGPDDPLLEQASPVTYIDPSDPPFFIMHGDSDTTVPLEQSQILFEKLQTAGVQAELLVVQHAGHGFRKTGSQAIQPGQVEINRKIVEFFSKELSK